MPTLLFHWSAANHFCSVIYDSIARVQDTFSLSIDNYKESATARIDSCRPKEGYWPTFIPAAQLTLHSVSVLSFFVAKDGYCTHLRRPTESVGQAQPWISDLSLRQIRLALQLFIDLIGHAQSTGANRMAKTLESPVHVHRQSTLAGKKA